MCVRAICGQINVFISYANQDGNAIYQPLSRALIKKDYDVWDSGCWTNADQLTKNDPFAMEYGYAVVLITEAYANSPYCLKELERLYFSNKLIIPFRTPNAQIPYLLRTQQCLKISSEPTVDEIQQIAGLIDALVEFKLGGILHSKDDLLETIHALVCKINHQ